jgi:membrane protein involved in colicin uptake
LEDRKERSPEEIMKLESAIRDRIRQIEIQRKIQDEMEKRAEEIKKSIRVEVYSDRIKKE